MGKKLIDIKEKVDSSNMLFWAYLERNLNPSIFSIIEKLSLKTNILIFSGVIRNFFLNINEFRDIDIVLTSEVDFKEEFSNASITTNNFGGYKIFLENTKIDLWFLDKTWAFQNQRNLGFNLEEVIPSTSFFNFSAICYSVREKRFIYTIHFLRFLRDKKIDVVYKPNFNYSLCVINTFYYSNKYNLLITDKLKKYIKYLHNSGNKDYSNIQIKHFGEIKFTNEDVERLINKLHS